MLLYVVTEEDASGSRTKLLLAVVGQNIKIGSRTKLVILSGSKTKLFSLDSGSKTKLIDVSSGCPIVTNPLVFILPGHLLVHQ